MENSTELVFVLQGLNDTKSNKRTYFVVTLLVYLFTICVNLTLIVTILLDRMLHEPMFIFLCNLCVNGIFGASTFYPKMLVDLSSDVSVTPYKACLTQMFVIYTYVFCEITTLTMMAYDRYVAICKPLNYHSIITPRKVVKLLIFTWLFSISETVIVVVLTARLPLCGFTMEKLYCSNWAIVKLSCVDTTINNVYGSILMVLHSLQAVVIVVSYVNIIKASVRSQEDRSKFMQTCLPHLISLINFSVAAVFDVMYARYGSSSSVQALRNFMSLEFLVVPPILNPLIYGLKMNQIRRRIFRICSRKTDALK
ncbi:olfactory receptor-like protein DTMT [Anguilla anguilla]|uniref:olfactory receptor-like protein DTMT n=1 Tax=Anguilla anguilla TaxID=7936 RepID=UPI0015B1BDF0|nr:olfactory receptor-like protein DTMT [Anguilla anguilla]